MSGKVKLISQSHNFSIDSYLFNVKLNVSNDTNGTNSCSQIKIDEVNITLSEFLHEQSNELPNDTTIEILNQSDLKMKFPNELHYLIFRRI